MKIISAGYIRVSSLRQVQEGKSLQSQEEIIRQQAMKQGETVYKIYRDEGISGANMDKREGLQAVLNDAKKGLFNKLYVWDLSRLTRSQLDIYRIIDELHRHNIELISLNNQGADFTTASGRLMTGIYGSINEYYRYQLKENIMQGMKTRSKNGYTSSKAALGYNLGNNKKEPLQVNEHEAGIIRLIFKLAEVGNGYRAIANTLNHKSYLTKKGNPFDTVAVKYILNNKLYCGYVVWGTHKDWNNKRRKGKSSPMIVEGKHEAIISEEQFERVQQVLQSRSKQPQVTGVGNKLTGLLRCPQCSGAMEVSHNTSRRKNQPDVRYKLYSCARSRRAGAEVCSANSVKASEIEPIVQDMFLQLLNNDELLEQVVDDANAVIDDYNNINPESNKQLKSDIDEVVNKIAQLQTLSDTDDSLTEVLSQPIAEYKEELKKKQQLQNDSVTEVDKSYIRYGKDNLETILQNVSSALEGKNTSLIKTAYSEIIERIEFKKVGRQPVSSVTIYLYPDVAALINEMNEAEGPNGSSAFLFSQGIVFKYIDSRNKLKVKNIL